MAKRPVYSAADVKLIFLREIEQEAPEVLKALAAKPLEKYRRIIRRYPNALVSLIYPWPITILAKTESEKSCSDGSPIPDDPLGASLGGSWQSSGSTRQVIPQKRLYPFGRALQQWVDRYYLHPFVKEALEALRRWVEHGYDGQWGSGVQTGGIYPIAEWPAFRPTWTPATSFVAPNQLLAGTQSIKTGSLESRIEELRRTFEADLARYEQEAAALWDRVSGHTHLLHSLYHVQWTILVNVLGRSADQVADETLDDLDDAVSGDAVRKAVDRVCERLRLRRRLFSPGRPRTAPH